MENIFKNLKVTLFDITRALHCSSCIQSFSPKEYVNNITTDASIWCELHGE